MYLPTLAVVKSCQVMSWLLGGIQTLRGAVASDGISGTMAPGLAFGRRQGHGGKLRTADAMEKVGTDWEFGGMRTWTRRNHVSDSEWLAETGGEIPYHTHARRPGSGATAGWRHVEFGNGLDGARPGSGETEDGWQVGVVGSGLESRVVRVPQEPKLGGGGGQWDVEGEADEGRGHLEMFKQKCWRRLSDTVFRPAVWSDRLVLGRPAGGCAVMGLG